MQKMDRMNRCQAQGWANVPLEKLAIITYYQIKLLNFLRGGRGRFGG